MRPHYYGEFGGIRLNTLTLRQAIIQRVHDKTVDDLRDVIESSIGNDERTLPGLGVLFELIWQDSEPAAQEQMVATLHHHLMETPAPLQNHTSHHG